MMIFFSFNPTHATQTLTRQRSTRSLDYLPHALGFLYQEKKQESHETVMLGVCLLGRPLPSQRACVPVSTATVAALAGSLHKARL